MSPQNDCCSHMVRAELLESRCQNMHFYGMTDRMKDGKVDFSNLVLIAVVATTYLYLHAHFKS